MLWAILTHLTGFVVDLVVGARRAEPVKDLEIALLRHQLRLLQRHAGRPPRLSRWEKLTLAVLAAKLGRQVAGSRSRLARAVLLVRPETVLKWHRELVRRKWTYRRRNAGGRPVSATMAIRSHHSLGHIRSGGPSIHLVETTENRARGDCGSGAHRMIPVSPWFGDTLVDALVRSRMIEVPDIFVQDAP